MIDTVGWKMHQILKNILALLRCSTFCNNNFFRKLNIYEEITLEVGLKFGADKNVNT